MTPVEVGQYLVVDPRVCHGELTFKGTRIPTETALAHLAKGRTIEEVLAGWSELTREAVAEAVRLAARALVERHTPGEAGPNGAAAHDATPETARGTGRSPSGR